MGLAPASASGYSDVPEAIPRGQFGCGFPVFGAGTQAVIDEEATRMEVAPGSCCVQVWGWLCAAPRSGSTFVLVTWHPFRGGSCTMLYDYCVLVSVRFVKLHYLPFLIGEDSPLVCWSR